MPGERLSRCLFAGDQISGLIVTFEFCQAVGATPHGRIRSTACPWPFEPGHTLRVHSSFADLRHIAFLRIACAAAAFDLAVAKSSDANPSFALATASWSICFFTASVVSARAPFPLPWQGFASLDTTDAVKK